MTISKAKQLGRFIRRHREAKGLSNNALAREVDVDNATILRMERGDFQSPSPQILQRIGRALDVAVEDLYALAGYTMPEGLPELAPYLRAKYDLPDKAVKELDSYFKTLQDRYGGKKGGRDAKRSR